MVEAEWPTTMEVDRSDWITIKLVRVAAYELLATVETSRSVVVGTTIPIPTAYAHLQTDPSTEYVPYAVASLAGAAFEVVPLTPADQPLDSPVMQWQWNIFPKGAGMQALGAKIDVEWRPKDVSLAPVRYELWQTRFAVKVKQPVIEVGRLSLLSMASAALGSVLTIPWLVGLIQERAEKRRAAEAAKPKIVRPGSE
jgi:hypothetical protein